ncbi:DUF4280 domain-containing protein [Clostridium sp.]|uniref:DUF4280 domain-containing protein n=1 Tax=Clostridium sp. TaxID=1506 RepID=UPI002616884E|nr:DUF4280 domain-containing protein [Clostridium sp.]
MSDEDQYYIVRGAKMVCDKGTHRRKINLPYSHGSYIKGKPMMYKKDRVIGENISYFGICTGDCPSSENIYLVGENGQTVSGKKCAVTILDDWMDVKEDALIRGEPALTTDSVLVCKYGGQITFVTTGQEDD